MIVPVLLTLLLLPQAPELNITLVGNAGVLLSDGSTSLLVDLPYESGAYGYMEYEPSELSPSGDVTAVITHHHQDHFDLDLFLPQREWTIIGPPSVTQNLPSARVLHGDSVSLGEFAVVTIPTPHTDDHRSYRIRWRGRVLHFAGDTEAPEHLRRSPRLDVLFVTPWLSCAASEAGVLGIANRRVAYHLDPGGGDHICGDVDMMAQGTSFTLTGDQR